MFLSMPAVYLGVAVVHFLQLQVFSTLAGQVHPLPFEPFHAGFLQKWFSIYFSHKCDIFTFVQEIHIGTAMTKFWKLPALLLFFVVVIISTYSNVFCYFLMLLQTAGWRCGEKKGEEIKNNKKLEFILCYIVFKRIRNTTIVCLFYGNLT